MNENLEQVRFEQLKRVLPDIFAAESMLYVGGHFRYGRDLQMTKYFKCPIDCVEIFTDNVKQLRQSERLRTVYHSDIRTFTPKLTYDVTMFWHGPEHLPKIELLPLTLKMAQYTKMLIVFATPNGIYEQPAEYDNPNEVHVSHYRIEDFLNMGFEADAIGHPDQKQGNIIAWKRIG